MIVEFKVISDLSEAGPVLVYGVLFVPWMIKLPSASEASKTGQSVDQVARSLPNPSCSW